MHEVQPMNLPRACVVFSAAVGSFLLGLTCFVVIHILAFNTYNLNQNTYALIEAAAFFWVLVFLAFVTWRKGISVTAQFSLTKKFKFRYWVIGPALGIISHFLVVNDTAIYEIGGYDGVFRSDGANQSAWWKVVLLAPVVEELVFRGFFFRSAELSKIPSWLVVSATSVIFVVIHHQYTLAALTLILPISIGLGVVRYLSLSVYPAILGHIAFNSMNYI